MLNSRWIGPLLLVAVVSACATGNTFKDVSPRIPPLPLAQGRLYVYRSGDAPTTLAPPVSLAGIEVGAGKPASFFFVDRDPGRYELRVADDAAHALPLKLDAGQTHYVRLEIRSGLTGDYLVPVDVSEVDSAKEILPLDYSGVPLSKRRISRALPLPAP